MTKGKPCPLGWGYPIMWGFSDTFINPDFTRVLVLGVVPPRGGFPTLDEPVVPHCFHHPKNETINPAEGVTDETPTTKNPPPQDGKGVMPLLLNTVSNCSPIY